MEVVVGITVFVGVIVIAIRRGIRDEARANKDRNPAVVEKPLPPLDLPKKQPRRGTQTGTDGRGTTGKWSPESPARREMAANARACIDRFHKAHVRTLSGRATIIDGDTVIIQKTKIRLFGIDAPELDQPFGQKSKWALVALCKGQTVTAHINGDLSHDRVVAVCKLPCGMDLGAEMVRQGLALDWPRFSGGTYRHLEPEGIRKKMFRTARRCV